VVEAHGAELAREDLLKTRRAGNKQSALFAVGEDDK
jgi:hypothetical protein